MPDMDVCPGCGRHRFLSSQRCPQLNPDGSRFHLSPYLSHRLKGIRTGHPLGLHEWVGRLISEARET